MDVVHADWGVHPRKRWVAAARGDVGAGWLATAARRATTAPALHHQLSLPPGGTTLVGFDFPIGVPRAYAALAGLDSFRQLFEQAGSGRWAEFFDVAETAEQISVHRPFYPRTANAKGQVRRDDLTAALGLEFAQLLRRCERKQPTRRAACPLFWTLGGNQAGKGALAGWRLLRAHPGGVALWPFDGALDDLLGGTVPVVAETYPASSPVTSAWARTW